MPRGPHRVCNATGSAGAVCLAAGIDALRGDSQATPRTMPSSPRKHSEEALHFLTQTTDRDHFGTIFRGSMGSLREARSPPWCQATAV